MTKTELIFQTLKTRIETGELPEGTKLMSLRAAAHSFSVSKNIIVAVYERLVANGLVNSRQGAGFFVEPMTRSHDLTTNLQAARDAVSLLQSQLDRTYRTLVGDGRAPEEWMANAFPVPNFDPGESGYGTAGGSPVLREYIAAGQVSAGIRTSPGQVVTTYGGNHAIDLILRRFAATGDTVIVEEPGYYPLYAKLKLAGIKALAVPRGPQGPNLEALDAAARKSEARLFFTQSLGQNPTGCSLDLPTAHGVLQLAEKYDFRVIDDDPFIDLPGTNGVRLASLDQFNRVIQVGTYAKLLSPALRSGFLIGSLDTARELAELKMITTVASSVYVEKLIAESIRSRRYEKHLNRFARRLRQERETGMERFQAMGFEVFGTPDAGLYGWLILPEGLDDLEVAAEAAEDGIFLAPGSLFRVSGRPAAPAMRINWSRVNDTRFFSYLRGLRARAG